MKKKEKTSLGSNKRNVADTQSKKLAEGLKSHLAAPKGKRRKLRKGELVPFPQIGMPSAKIGGTTIEVVEYPDGTISPILPAISKLIDQVFRRIILSSNDTLTNEEFVFVRRHLGMTQEHLAEELNIARGTINRYEKGKLAIPREKGLAIRFFGLLHILNQLPADVREAIRPEMESLQKALNKDKTAASERFYKLDGNKRVELTFN
ncbi:MAG: helix-turn-helix domain-containing protein [Candidatus Sumerlaeia bacterium]|nr:helix-turn-helix domain-containing protein [Candidatus Sumerlaeia bacterium]